MIPRVRLGQALPLPGCGRVWAGLGETPRAVLHEKARAGRGPRAGLAAGLGAGRGAESPRPGHHGPANHLIVFLRAGELGRVKRRLGAGIGAVAALAFYRRTAGALLRRLGRDPRWRLCIAVTPDIWADGRRRGLGGIAAPGVPLLAQGRGDLGARMGRAFFRPCAGPVVIVGGDIPDLGPAHIARAFRALGRFDAVFGPAPDGGFWLVGVRRRPRTPRLFRDVRWSGPHALADTLANLDSRQHTALLDRLEDVDDAAAYRRWPAARRKQ